MKWREKNKKIVNTFNLNIFIETIVTMHFPTIIVCLSLEEHAYEHFSSHY